MCVPMEQAIMERAPMPTSHRFWSACALAFGLAWGQYVPAQNANWDSYLKAGRQALGGGQYDRAEKLCTLALKEAESFDAADPRLTITLRDLAAAQYLQGKYEPAESLLERALETDELVR